MDKKPLLGMNKDDDGQIILPDDTYQILVLERPSNNEVLHELFAIFELIHQFHSDNWPDDSFWCQHLPFSFVSKFSLFYIEDLDYLYENPNGTMRHERWEFLSWLDALKERGWEWWSGDLNETTLTIVLLINDIPERLDAMLEIFRILHLNVTRHFVNYYSEKEIRHLNLYEYD